MIVAFRLSRAYERERGRAISLPLHRPMRPSRRETAAAHNLHSASPPAPAPPFEALENLHCLICRMGCARVNSRITGIRRHQADRPGVGARGAHTDRVTGAAAPP
ncbi:hypothetical protein EVAR_95881_1 [Eumeta japonica]|uniref:Uncharacterized protein n=1 Tax=Eumeta variegata TaxID=151549 RepID=A0A4C1VMP8_EUMVA|nr:hypothetical protein EVAR_95881_1 [Eumeta japonica]